jgi:hypothetical protein
MSIKVKIADAKTISTNVSGTGRIRISSQAFAIKPSLPLDDFTDVTTVGAKNEDYLIFNARTRKFLPAEPSSSFELLSVSGGTF